MFRLPIGTGFNRLFGTSTGERSRTKRGFQSDFVRKVELLEDRSLLSTVTVHVLNDSFSPKAVTISPGDTIHWVWDEGVHSTTSVKGSAESWDSDVFTSSHSFDHKFTNLGSFNYYCTVHGFDNGNGTAGGMAGTITVKNIVPLKSIGVSPHNPTISGGATQQFVATAVYADNTTANITNQVTWASAAPSVATISGSGKATGQAKGFSVVTAKLNGITGSSLLTVTQAAPPRFTSENRVYAGSGRKQKLTGFQLNFSGALNGAVAQNTAHYSVVTPGRTRRALPAHVPVLAAAYNPLNYSITLTLGKFKANKPLSLTATGLTGISGTPVSTITTNL